MWLSDGTNGANSALPLPLSGQKQDILSPIKIIPKSDSTTTSKDPNQIKPGNLSYNCRSFLEQPKINLAGSLFLVSIQQSTDNS